jgi:basic amino acid/polyamine antiporter, APA family
MTQNEKAAPSQKLSLFDAICLIVGIILGVGIYQMTPDIASASASFTSITLDLGQYHPTLQWSPTTGLIGLWVIGGLLSLCGALSYAELATAYPREGGDYVYLNKAYGNWAGFLFGWMITAVVRPADIVFLAWAFANYATAIWAPELGCSEIMLQKYYAGAGILLLTSLHIIGVQQGKWAQNLLTVVKVLGIVLIILAVVFGSPAAVVKGEPSAGSGGGLPWSLALLFVLFSFGGWGDIAYVAGEVKNAQRNIVRTAVIGLAAVTLLYIGISLAFIHILGFEGVMNSKAVAADAITKAQPSWGVYGARVVSGLICISALGAVSCMIFTGARVSFALGKDYRFFERLGKWNPKTQTPVLALLLQMILCFLYLGLFKTYSDAITFASCVLYAFFFLTCLAVIVLRVHQPEVERPFKVPFYPITPLIFGGVCIFLANKTIMYNMDFHPKLMWIAMEVLILGSFIYYVSRFVPKKADDAQNNTPS